MKSIVNLVRNRATSQDQPNFRYVRNDASEATLYIYDVIDAYWGISANAVIAALQQAAGVGTLHLRFNSPGGDVFEGQAISEAVRRFSGKTVAHIDSLAASAASSIAIAADEVVMSPGAFFMIHNASGIAFGDKQEMRHTADLLEKVELSIAQAYVQQTGMSLEDVAAAMEAETWYSADEAVAAKFANSIAEHAPKATNAWNLSNVFKHPPATLAVAPTNTVDDEQSPLREHQMRRVRMASVITPSQ